MKGEMTQKGKEALERFKMESASEVGVNLKDGYNGDLTSREAGAIGGRMVQKMINSYKRTATMSGPIFAETTAPID